MLDFHDSVVGLYKKKCFHTFAVKGFDDFLLTHLTQFLL